MYICDFQFCPFFEFFGIFKVPIKTFVALSAGNKG